MIWKNLFYAYITEKPLIFKGEAVMKQRILELTKKLVNIPSQNATEGERNIGVFLYEYIKEIPYFKEHPDQIVAVPLKKDSLQRMNVFALLLGEKSKKKDTIILHGHTDTVGVEDFGNLKKYAFDCDRLREELLKIKDDLPQEVKEDLISGDYLFGRGSSDMKSGVAVHLVVLEEMCKRKEELKGNILVSFNPVEESLHQGMIEAIDVLTEWKNKFFLEYIFAINNDYICGMYPGDETRYLYTGSVGKLLPSFYVKGKETHVGQPFEGVDACRISAELVKRIHLNTDMCDGYEKEYPSPPAVLQMRDLKLYYSVQTPISSFVYFNYMVHNKSVKEIMDMLKETAQISVDTVIQEMEERYKKYCELAKISYQKLNIQIQILEYKEVYIKAQNCYKGDLDQFIQELAEKSIGEKEDKRETSKKIVEQLVEIAGIKMPTIVVYFSTPHCPHNTLKKEVEEEYKLEQEITELVSDFAKEEKEIFKVMHFFPSLSDSSYLKLDDDRESIKTLSDNFPKQDLLYPVPYEKIRNLNIPGLNYGTFGKDAHKWTERVKMSYSFEKLPKLIIRTIEEYLM